MTARICRQIDLRAALRKYVVSSFAVASALFGCIEALGQAPSNKVDEGVAQQRGCLKTAQRVLGPKAKVLKIGELNHAGVLECIAAIPVAPKSPSVSGIFAKDLVILKRNRDEWNTALRASRLIQNEAGYIGSEYIDDCSPFWADHIEFGAKRPDGQKGLVISIQWRESEDDNDSMPTDIAWDDATGRYRETTENGFQREARNLPHKCPGSVSKGAP
jgi:hypothetical protein